MGILLWLILSLLCSY